jgi:hypothetical protein
VQWSQDSERVATGTVVNTVISHDRGPQYDVEIHFNPGLFYGEMSEDQLELVHPDTLRETLESKLPLKPWIEVDVASWHV